MTLLELSRLHGFKPHAILHVGAGMLEEADMYREMGVEKVIWIEALPPSERRQSQAKKYGHQLYESTAFSDKTEPVHLSVASNEVSSSILPFNRHSVIYPDIYVKEVIPLTAVRADEFFGTAFPKSIDTLVLDVQGAELKVLNGLGSLIEQIKCVFAEVNLTSLYSGCVLKPELDQWMITKGFWDHDMRMVHWPEWSECLYRRRY